MKNEGVDLTKPLSNASSSGTTETGPISRRDFVRTGSAIMLASGSAVCGDGSGPTATGTIRLILTGLNPSATSGGTATATPTSGGNTITINIPPSGDQQAQAPVGSYTVTYAPPAGHLVAPETPVPSTVTVTEGQTTTIALTLLASGSISVTVSGLGSSPASGGSASAQRTDAAGAAIPITISTSGTGTVNGVPAGTYSVTYTAPAGFNITSTNPLTGLVVVVGAATPANFTVAAIAATGTLRIVINGHTGASTGGVSNHKPQGSGGAGTNTNLPAPVGSTTTHDITGVATGPHEVTHTPPAGFRHVAGQVATQIASITQGNTTTVTWNTEAVPASAGLVFASSWPTVGNTDAAVRDGGKWTTSFNINNPVNATTSPGGRVFVMSAAGLNFPAGMANVLAIRYEQVTQTFCGINKQNGWNLPAPGGVLCRRLYFRHNIDGSNTVTHHPVQSAFTAGSCPYAAEWVMDKNDTFRFQVATLVDGNPSANQHRWQTTLQRGQTYRVEERYERVSSTVWKLHIRIYHSSDETTPIRTDPNFQCDLHSAHTLAAGLDIVIPDPTCMQHMFIVNQGVGPGRGSDTATSNLIYYGGFAVSLTDWCGPFVPGEGS